MHRIAVGVNPVAEHIQGCLSAGRHLGLRLAHLLRWRVFLLAADRDGNESTGRTPAPVVDRVAKLCDARCAGAQREPHRCSVRRNIHCSLRARKGRDGGHHEHVSVGIKVIEEHGEKSDTVGASAKRIVSRNRRLR